MELSRRLSAVADLVSKNRRVADIGCDHGYVSIYLAKEKHCPKVIAMDVNEGPLMHAEKNIHKFGMSRYIDVRLSDGTAALEPGEADALLISGMGGRLMVRILRDGIDRLGHFEELVLQPQSEIEIVRAFLRENGYSITDEDFVIEDGKNYPMMKALYKKDSGTAGSSPYCERLQDLFGPVLLQKRPADFVTYLQDKKTKSEAILSKITQPDKREEMERFLEDLTFVLENPEG